MNNYKERYNFLYPIVEDALGELDKDDKFTIDEATREVMANEDLIRDITDLIEEFLRDIYTER